MKNFLIVVLISISFFGCKKDAGGKPGLSNNVKYEWNSETTGVFTAAWSEEGNPPATAEFTGKTWSRSFTINPGPKHLLFSIRATDFVIGGNGPIIGIIKIYVGGKLVQSREVTLLPGNDSVILNYFKAE
jgi:hypothetical protein